MSVAGAWPRPGVPVRGSRHRPARGGENGDGGAGPRGALCGCACVGVRGRAAET